MDQVTELSLTTRTNRNGRDWRRDGWFLRGSPEGRARPLLLAFVLSTLLFAAGATRPEEYEVEAAYLLNFGKFVTWPGLEAKHPAPLFPICILGQDPFGRALDTMLAGERLEGGKLTAARIRKPQEALNCRMVFVSRSEGPHWGAILEVLGSAPVLTVSDLPDFVQRGGMIQFVLDQDRVRFTVNLIATTNARLTLSSQLLKVASSVRGNPTGETTH